MISKSESIHRDTPTPPLSSYHQLRQAAIIEARNSISGTLDLLKTKHRPQFGSDFFTNASVSEFSVDSESLFSSI